MGTDQIMDPITVRIMRHDDMSAIVELDSLTSGMPRGEYLQARVGQALDNPHSEVLSLVAESQGRVAGFLMAQVYLGEFGIPETVANVDTVGVHPEFQLRGVAKVLMDELLQHARKLGIERIRTMVSWEQGDLIGYFRNAGFAPGACLVLERSL